MGEWINVKDDRPKEGECVLLYLCVISDSGVKNHMIVESGYYRDSKWYDWAGDLIDDIFSESVLWWMPLPEPPKA